MSPLTGMLSFALVVLDRNVILGPSLGLEAQVLTLMCYGAPDIIDWSYILPYNRSVTQYSCQLSGTLSLAFVVLNNKTVVLGPGLGA